jgi:hypothetical protein
MLFFWPVLGAFIGYAAARRRGFSDIAGILGGLLLGPLAVLMFFVSGVTQADQNRKCPHCAEWIKSEARVCRFCSRDVEPQTANNEGAVSSRPVVGRGVLIFASVIFGFLIVVGLLTSAGILGPPTTISAAKFGALQTGMSRLQAEGIVGSGCTELSRTELAGILTFSCSWRNLDGSNAIVIFRNDRLITKSQFGLR